MDGVELHGATCPLLVKSDGSKMGKTETGAIWLSADRTSPYAFYQYWINVTDEDAGKCLRFLTDLNEAHIAELDAAQQPNRSNAPSQKTLASELTRLIHGEEGLRKAQRATDIFFGAEITDLSDDMLGAIFADVPSRRLDATRLADGFPVIDALLESGLFSSKGDVRRSIQQGGAYLNNRRVEQLDMLLTRDHLASETMMVVRSGRRKYALLRFQ